jgi:hypothetical protein
MGGTHDTDSQFCCCFTVKCGACRSCCWPCFKPCDCGESCEVDCCVVCREVCNCFQVCDEPPSWTFTCPHCDAEVSYYAIGETESDRRCDEIKAEHDRHCAAAQQARGGPKTKAPQQQNPLHRGDDSDDEEDDGVSWSCDGCGIDAMEGSGMPRFESTTRKDYDLCRKCYMSGKLEHNGPFTEFST